MKTNLLTAGLLAISSFVCAQGISPMSASNIKPSKTEILENKANLNNPRLFTLDESRLKSGLETAPMRFSTTQSKSTLLLPDADGMPHAFRMFETSNMEPELAARYPDIKSYVGQGIDDPSSTIYLSVSPLGLNGMILYADKSAAFIEPYAKDRTVYTIYKKSDKTGQLNKFECKVLASAAIELAADNELQYRPNADDGNLRNYRLALSVTGEYTTYFGGTKTLALAGMNNTMTRVNAIFERDFGVHMNLISNNDLIIYTNASTDPYSNAGTGAGGAWNQELQSTLTNTIGNSGYDIGHLFGASGGGGNAGCIACVCKNPTSSSPLAKGSGYTSPYDGIPAGDNFDVDYVAHEMGHQFGANHTFTHSNEGTGAQMEPGSGSTIMGYAGITGSSTDVQAHSDAYFHAYSIQQVTNYIKTTSCQTTVPTGNAVPTANAGADYTIPKGTPFMLTGSASDANGDVLTYDWEQMNAGTSSSTIPNATRTTGPAFRSISPSANPTRCFPQMSTVLTGATSWKWEVVPTVARTMNFRLTVRDNRAGGPANNSDDMVVTVNGTAGPFTVSSPNTAVSWAAGSTQNVTWNVAGTTANGVNAVNVDILLSTDGGLTFPITLLAGTPNDGTQSITVPNLPGASNRIMIKGSNHIFFDVSNTNFTITGGTADTTAPSTPTSLTASGTTSNSTNLTWTASTDNVAVIGYDVYQGTVLKATVASANYTVTALSPATTYSFTVRARDAAGNISSASNAVSVTTTAVTITYCTSQGNNTADERIGNVSLANINNSSGGTAGYEDFTTITANVSKGSNYTISITPTWTGTVYSEGYAVFIDYNQDGDFSDTGETVWTKASSTETPATGTITIPSGAATGLTRMRVSMKYNGVPTACEAISYGQVEDYSINISSAATDNTVPTAPTNLTATGTTTNSTNLAWTASTDNVGVTGYEVYRGSTLLATVATNSYAASGLNPASTYSFSVKAKDAAGNVSSASNVVSVTTLSTQVSYCSSQGNSVADEKIGKVVFGTITNTSTGGTGYENFTSLSTNVTRGSTYNISITPSWTSTSYNEGYSVWIDFNQDGDFNDAGEQVWTKAASKTTPVTGSITIPASALPGSTRMRVSMKYNGIPTACEAFSFGQVEDYTVNIISTAREHNSDAKPAAEVRLYPNPLSGSVLNITEVPHNSDYRITNMLGQQVAAGKVQNGQVLVSDIAAGSYILEILNTDQQIVKRFIKQ
jgi:chitodextrinase